ncbi:MAG TPA: PIN domain-containing protein [Gemmataceae bacterium]|nr:PIN domain-containing protein [Gemmataceae bacterium]
MVFLDANPVIYFVEQTPTWGPKAKARIMALLAAGEQLAVTDIVRMECLVGPLKPGDLQIESDFRTFFTSHDVRVLPIVAAVCERAARIRTTHGFKPLDSLHLAAAVEHGCTLFLTNDKRSSSFPDIPVEVLS